jgi:hypothetical protein
MRRYVNRRAYRVLLRLYPADYRAMFAAEMARAFDRILEERRGILLAELSGVITGAAAEWVAKWTTDASVRGRSLPDLRMMRPPGVTKELWFRSAGCS